MKYNTSSSGRGLMRMSRGKKIANFFRSFSFFDRRRDRRFSAQSPLQCFLVRGNLGAQERVACDIVNISRSGALLITSDQKIYPRNTIELEFAIPQQNQTVNLSASVVRTYRRHAEHRYYSAIKFSPNQNDTIAQVLKLATTL